MTRTLNADERRQISAKIRQFLAEELEVAPEEISDDTNIIDDLGADSILFLEMYEEFKDQLGIDLEIRTVGQYLLQHPAYTFAEITAVVFEFIEKGETLIEQLERP